MSELRCILLLDEQTYKARLVKINEREIWIPRSLTKTIVKFLPDKNGHRECVMDVEDWFLEKNDL